MYLPVWAIILLGVGWLGFLWLLIKRDGGRDLTQAPRAAAPSFTLPSLPGPEEIPPEVVAELRAMVANGQKLQAIKRLRELTHCSLTDAKEWVERL
jgi:hypothetical protein